MTDLKETDKPASENGSEPQKVSRMKHYGVLATGLYLALIALWVFLDWQRFLKLEPNAWGDFLAGTVGPLALFWVVLSFFLQSKELQNSVAELRNSVEQQSKLVDVSVQQHNLDRERLRLERDQLEAEEHQRIDAITPEFSVTDQTTHRPALARPITNICCKNRKGDAQSVFLTIRGNGANEPYLARQVFDNIEAFEEFRTTIESNSGNSEFDGIRLTVHSISREQTERKQTFSFHNGRFSEVSKSFARRIPVKP